MDNKLLGTFNMLGAALCAFGYFALPSSQWDVYIVGVAFGAWFAAGGVIRSQPNT